MTPSYPPLPTVPTTNAGPGWTWKWTPGEVFESGFGDRYWRAAQDEAPAWSWLGVAPTGETAR